MEENILGDKSAEYPLLRECNTSIWRTNLGQKWAAFLLAMNLKTKTSIWMTVVLEKNGHHNPWFLTIHFKLGEKWAAFPLFELENKDIGLDENILGENGQHFPCLHVKTYHIDLEKKTFLEKNGQHFPCFEPDIDLDETNWKKMGKDIDLDEKFGEHVQHFSLL